MLDQARLDVPINTRSYIYKLIQILPDFQAVKHGCSGFRLMTEEKAEKARRKNRKAWLLWFSSHDRPSSMGSLVFVSCVIRYLHVLGELRIVAPMIPCRLRGELLYGLAEARRERSRPPASGWRPARIDRRGAASTRMGLGAARLRCLCNFSSSSSSP